MKSTNMRDCIRIGCIVAAVYTNKVWIKEYVIRIVETFLKYNNHYTRDWLSNLILKANDGILLDVKDSKNYH